MVSPEIKKWTDRFPELLPVSQGKTVTWLNPHRRNSSELDHLPVSQQDMDQAAALWDRFAPYLAKAFPELKNTGGIIESELREIPHMKARLEAYYKSEVSGRLFLKCDHNLPVVGSIKARGGIFEVLHYAEELALQNGLIQEGDNYEIFDDERFKSFFSQYTIGVGSTGNLGLSIGVISAKLGFDVYVYMSSDAKEWKKNLLRQKGAKVLEFEGDFSEAIDNGRRSTNANPKGYFVDDENSKYLFLGYSVAALRLKDQLDAQGIVVDADHPLFVYSPCGVGGSPGGVAYGLREVFGDHVHSFFVEPTHAPAVLIGLITGAMADICVQDIGLDNHTEADGLAVGRPSAFASAINDLTISGEYTIEDDELFRLLFMLHESEGIHVEPSATAGFPGPQNIARTGFVDKLGVHPDNITHIVWSTGGALVPKENMEQYVARGRALVEVDIP